jgi:glycosyltransferase involved in cell wall biosynthesis
MRQMVRFLRQEQPQIVQSFLPWTNICGTIAAKIARVPIIITGRRANIREQHMDFRRFPDQWLQDLCNVWTTVVLANSYNVKHECLQREKYLAKEKIRVIYNGVDAARYAITSEKAATRNALGIPDTSMIVGIIASLHPRKGHRDFLKAASIVLHRYPKTIFLIVGQDVGIRQELEALARRLHIDDCVRFTGERDDIPEILDLLDVQVSASYVEGLSNALLEGMAAGKPIVATDVAGNSELVIHEQTGLLIPPGDPDSLARNLLRLLEDKPLRERYGNAARRRVETMFQMDHMIYQTETLYESLVAGKKGA